MFWGRTKCPVSRLLVADCFLCSLSSSSSKTLPAWSSWYPAEWSHVSLAWVNHTAQSKMGLTKENRLIGRQKSGGGGGGERGRGWAGWHSARVWISPAPTHPDRTGARGQRRRKRSGGREAVRGEKQAPLLQESTTRLPAWTHVTATLLLHITSLSRAMERGGKP